MHHLKKKLADFAVPETIIFKNFFDLQPVHRLPRPSSARTQSVRQRRGVSGRSGDLHFHAQNGSSSFPEPCIFNAQKRLKLVPEPRIFKLKTAQARSGAPHFHTLDRELVPEPLPIFHFAAAHTYTKIWGRVPPPPPPPRGSRLLQISKMNLFSLLWDNAAVNIIHIWLLFSIESQQYKNWHYKNYS